MILFPLYGAGCERPPDRQGAAILIGKELGVHDDYVRTLALVSDRCGAIVDRTNPCCFFGSDRTALQCLEKLGIAADAPMEGLWPASLKEQGYQFCSWTPSATSAGVTVETARLPVAGPVLEEVTGVAVGDSKRALNADFRWRYKVLASDAVWNCIKTLPSAVAAAQRYLAEGRTGTATLQKYDDGWRVVDLTLSGMDVDQMCEVGLVPGCG